MLDFVRQKNSVIKNTNSDASDTSDAAEQFNMMEGHNAPYFHCASHDLNLVAYCAMLVSFLSFWPC